MGYSPWDRKESDTTERLHFTFTLRSHGLKITRLFCPRDFLGKNTSCCCCYCSASKSCPTLQPHGLYVAHQASLSFIISQSLLKFMSIESMMLFNHLILCYPLLLLPSILPSIWVFSSESAPSHQMAKVLGLQFQHESF